MKQLNIPLHFTLRPVFAYLHTCENKIYLDAIVLGYACLYLVIDTYTFLTSITWCY